MYNLFTTCYYINENLTEPLKLTFSPPRTKHFCWYRYVSFSYCWLTNHIKFQWLKQTFITMFHDSGRCGFAHLVWAPSGFCGRLAHISVVRLEASLKAGLARVAVWGTSAPRGIHPLLTLRPTRASFQWEW